MKGLIFDMDGTMVDNMMVHHRAWQRKLAELGIEMDLGEVKEKIHGVNEEILERIFPGRFSPEERKIISAQKEAAYREIFLPQLRLVDGLSNFLTHCFAEGLPMSIGTAAPKENVDFVLDNLELRSYFRGVVHAGDVIYGKPNPEVFIRAAEAMSQDVTECLIFEDSITGAEAALRAGAEVMILTTTHRQEEFEEFDHIVAFLNNFEDLTLADLRRKVYG